MGSTLLCVIAPDNAVPARDQVAPMLWPMGKAAVRSHPSASVVDLKFATQRIEGDKRISNPETTLES
jgi:hypothetical protein